MDQESGVEIMYPNLYKGLRLKQDDFTRYETLIIGFDDKVLTPRGMIRFPVQIVFEVVEVDFIVVDTYSPYTAIPSTLHLKVKYPIEGGIGKLLGC